MISTSYFTHFPLNIRNGRNGREREMKKNGIFFYAEIKPKPKPKSKSKEKVFNERKMLYASHVC